VSDVGARPQLHEAIQTTASLDDDLEGAVLLGWVMVAEWVAPTGKRWLSRLDGTANGSGCPDWQREGYLHNALFSDGFDNTDGPDDDDDD
jgi:hypothetical protein